MNVHLPRRWYEANQHIACNVVVPEARNDSSSVTGLRDFAGVVDRSFAIDAKRDRFSVEQCDSKASVFRNQQFCHTCS